jgi:hypothetical protein
MIFYVIPVLPELTDTDNWLFFTELSLSCDCTFQWFLFRGFNSALTRNTVQIWVITWAPFYTKLRMLFTILTRIFILWEWFYFEWRSRAWFFP